jgi:hypothetical protein
MKYEYIIVADDSLDDLAGAVNNRLRDGYELVGGVCQSCVVVDGKLFTQFAQALVRRTVITIKPTR